jgi:hypothetical protein
MRAGESIEVQTTPPSKQVDDDLRRVLAVDAEERMAPGTRRDVPLLL